MLRSLFGRKQRKESDIPQLDEHMLAVVDTIKGEVLRQVSTFEGGSMAACPSYGDWEDDMIAAYVWGFQTGYFQVKQEDVKWSRGDEAIAMLGRSVVSFTALLGIFGPERGAVVSENSPMISGRSHLITESHRTMDVAGGADGIARARGTLNDPGNLATFLRHNTVRSSA